MAKSSKGQEFLGKFKEVNEIINWGMNFKMDRV